MSTPVIRGSGELVFQGYNRRFSSTSGHQIGYIYEGTTEKCDAAYTANTASGGASDADMEIDGTNNTARVTFWYGGTSNETADQQETFDTWELVGSADTQPIYQHPKVLAWTDVQIAQVKAAVTAREQDPEAVITTFAGHQKTVFDHVIGGYEGYQEAHWVLRRTTTVGALYSGELNFTDTFKLLTTAQVKAAESIPAGIQWDMDKIDLNVPTLGTGGTLASVFDYYWMKQPPTRTQTGVNKFNLTYEYWHGKWSTFLYELKT